MISKSDIPMIIEDIDELDAAADKVLRDFSIWPYIDRLVMALDYAISDKEAKILMYWALIRYAQKEITNESIS